MLDALVMREQVRLNRRLNQSVLLVGSVVVQRSAKRKFLDAARLDVRGTFLGATLFKRYTVCTAKMAEPIDGKASNRLRYTLSVVLDKKTDGFSSVFIVRFRNRRHAQPYESRPPLLVSVAALPCERGRGGSIDNRCVVCTNVWNEMPTVVQARRRTAWTNNIRTWTGLPVEESVSMTEIRGPVY